MKKKSPISGMAINCSPNDPPLTMYPQVLYDKKISSTSKLIHCEIVNNFNYKNYCILTNAEIAKLFGMSKTTVSTKISELIKAGYLKSETVQVKPFDNADYTIAERRLTW